MQPNGLVFGPPIAISGLKPLLQCEKNFPLTDFSG